MRRSAAYYRVRTFVSVRSHSHAALPDSVVRTPLQQCGSCAYAIRAARPPGLWQRWAELGVCMHVPHRACPAFGVRAVLVVVLAAAALCQRAEARSNAHPCAEAASSRTAAFASTCRATSAVSRVGVVTVYACVPLNATTGADDVAARVDALVRTYTPSAFVGRLVPAALLAAQTANASVMSTWEGTVALQFDLEREELVHGGGNGQFLCTRGMAQLVAPGTYAYVVVHEFSHFLWDAPWNPEPRDGSPFGTLLVDEALRHPATSPLPATDELLEVAHGAKLSADDTDQLPECSSHAMAGTWRAGHFVPFRCSLRSLSHPQFDSCMSRLNGTVHLFGDSNSRRASKALVSRGAWCAPGSEDLPHCRCEDCGNVCDAPENTTVPRLWERSMTAGVFVGTGVINATDGSGAEAGVSKLVFHGMSGYAPGVFNAVLEEQNRLSPNCTEAVVCKRLALAYWARCALSCVILSYIDNVSERYNYMSANFGDGCVKWR